MSPAADSSAGRRAEPAAIAFDHVSLAFDDQEVLRDVSFSIAAGTMRVLLGASGSGKSVLLKLALGLLRPDEGTIHVHGECITAMKEAELLRVRGDVGMLFQESALFDSLTVGENVGYRLAEELRLPADDVNSRVLQVLGFVGLSEYADVLPSQLSGGQRRRVAIARAMATQPRLLLLDDPTTGLDPITATTVDDEIVKLRDLQHVTAVVATHQIRDAFYMATHRATSEADGVRILPLADGERPRADFMVLHEGRIAFTGSADELLGSDDPYLRRLLFMTLPPW